MLPNKWHFIKYETTPSQTAKYAKINPCLVPYECSSDEDEVFDNHQHLAETDSTGSSFRGQYEALDETYQPPDTSTSQDSCVDNTETSSKETELEEETRNNNDIRNARKRKKKADEGEWIRIKNKRLRMKGEAYLGFSKNKGEKIKQNHPRRARTLKGTCN